MSEERIEKSTDPAVNARIRRDTEMSVVFHTGRPELIKGRLAELDREWDVERALIAMSSSVTLASLTLGLLRNRRFLVLPLLVQGFLLNHAVQGWCPPLPVLRRLGFRTRHEIDRERHALASLHGERGAEPTRVAGEGDPDRPMRAVGNRPAREARS